MVDVLEKNIAASSLSAALEAQEYLRTRLSNPSKSKAFSSIPIIDISPSFSSSLESRQSVANQINDACTKVGFFYIVGHGIRKEVCDDVLKVAGRFFHELNDTQKDALHMRQSKQFRGYEPASYSQVNAFEAKETKEAFNWGYEVGLDPSGGDGKYVELDGSVDDNPNIWPKEEDLPGFYKGIGTYYGQALQLARHLFRLFALSLALTEEYFDPVMTHPGAIARLIRYPPATNPTPLVDTHDEIGLGAHTDYECFTLLLQSSPGLEVLSPDGHWIAAEPVEGGIVVNVADFLMRWTNGAYKSTIHRVVNRTEKERFSVPVFFSINYDETVETLPSCVGEGNPSKYPPITAGQYVLDRLALTLQTGEY